MGGCIPIQTMDAERNKLSNILDKKSKYNTSKSQTSTSVSTAEMPPILPGFLYPPFYMLGNLVTSSTCCSSVIVKSTVGVVEDWSWMMVDVGRDQ